MWDQSDFSLAPWFQQSTLLSAFKSLYNERFHFTFWSNTLLPSENWSGLPLESLILLDGHMCCPSCTPSREREIEDVLHDPAEHSCTAKCSYFSSGFCLKYLIVSFPYLRSHVCQQTDCWVFSSAVVPAATGALLHKAMWHCSVCFYLQCVINM